MRGHSYTNEQVAYLSEHILDGTWDDLAVEFNKHFGTDLTAKALRAKSERCIGKQQKLRHYTSEQNDFIKANISKYSFAELADAFNARFGTCVSTGAMKRKCNTRMGLKRSYNSSRQMIGERNRSPIGSLSKTGKYYVVKLDDTGNRWDNWKYLHRHIYEEHHGELAPDQCVIFLNGDHSDLRPENLYAIDSYIMRVMNANKWFSSNPEITLTAIKLCELRRFIKV